MQKILQKAKGSLRGAFASAPRREGLAQTDHVVKTTVSITYDVVLFEELPKSVRVTLPQVHQLLTVFVQGPAGPQHELAGSAVWCDDVFCERPERSLDIAEPARSQSNMHTAPRRSRPVRAPTLQRSERLSHRPISESIVSIRSMPSEFAKSAHSQKRLSISGGYRCLRCSRPAGKDCNAARTSS